MVWLSLSLALAGLLLDDHNKLTPLTLSRTTGHHAHGLHRSDLSGGPGRSHQGDVRHVLQAHDGRRVQRGAQRQVVDIGKHTEAARSGMRSSGSSSSRSCGLRLLNAPWVEIETKRKQQARAAAGQKHKKEGDAWCMRRVQRAREGSLYAHTSRVWYHKLF